MARLTKEQLDAIKAKYGVKTIWSYSRVNTFMTSPYEYLLKYIKHIKEDRTDCAYTTLGTLCHDTLDEFYEGKIEFGDMAGRFDDGWLTAIDIADLKLDRNDEAKNKSLSERYKNNLVHFFANHTIYDKKLHIEMPITINVNGNIFVGYIDACYKDDDGFCILDFKSSSIYTGKTLGEHSQQLQLYCLGVRQKTGIPLEKIRCGFNFLKYVTIEYTQKNGAIKERNVERSKIGESLQANAKTWLKAFGYNVDEYLKKMVDTNGIDCLPDEVKAKYVIKDCHVYVDTSQKAIDKLIADITTIITDINLREQDYRETHNERAFWDTDASVQSQSYYFATLCGYSPNLHLPYKAYLDKLEKMKNGQDTFGGVGSDTDEPVVSVSVGNVTKNTENEEIDLSWLDNL